MQEEQKFDTSVTRIVEGKEAWTTPEMSDYQVEALTEAFIGSGDADGGIYS